MNEQDTPNTEQVRADDPRLRPMFVLKGEPVDHILTRRGVATLRLKGVDVEKAIHACRLLVDAYERGRESEHVDWSDVDLACEMAVEALRGADTPEEASEASTGGENVENEASEEGGV